MLAALTAAVLTATTAFTPATVVVPVKATITGCRFSFDLADPRLAHITVERTKVDGKDAPNPRAGVAFPGAIVATLETADRYFVFTNPATGKPSRWGVAYRRVPADAQC